ncbi:HEPN domain-containing protein [Marispirochaeta sp.]|uniref:HEPN domain-containing protein n=1 Tax=Marispirochaeta sp. TaxID=2038653 RepID=UPI0029C6B4DD|nr:HEPN domain-containing protein [Marispirochaeta sp.]
MDAALEHEKYITQIPGALMQVDPYKIILFGSAATGNLHNDSDIIVVLNNETIPKNYDEKMRLKLSVRKALREINKHVPKSHDLTTLSQKITDLLTIDFDYDILDQMNELYIEARYPSELGSFPNGKPTKRCSKSVL